MRSLLCFMLLSTTMLFGQNEESLQVKSAVETFFEGFHKGDTTLMKSVMMPKVTMQTAYINGKGEGVFVDDGGTDKLLNAIANRPDDQKWDERLSNFDIKIAPVQRAATCFIR